MSGLEIGCLDLYFVRLGLHLGCLGLYFGCLSLYFWASRLVFWVPVYLQGVTVARAPASLF